MGKVVDFVLSPIGALIGGKVGKILGGLSLIVAGVLTGNMAFVGAGLGRIGGALAGKPKVSKNSVDRLTASMVSDASRKIVLGRTAMATDVRYQGYTGDDQEFVHWIMAVAAHSCEAVEEIWFDSKKAWTASGGVEDDFDDYLTVDVRNPGTSGNGIAINAVWTSTATLTGCAYLHLRFKTTGNSKKAESPFSSSLPSRITVRGKGALLPDVRESGCEADDQTTWDWFDDDSGRNPALQLLFYLIGWRIGGKLSVGRGMPVGRIDIDSFVTAANFCDEPVSLAAGGTEPRFRCDGVFGEDDSPSVVIGNLCGSMNAVLRDVGGRLSVHIIHNDLATPVAAFTEADILGDEEWLQTPPVDEYFSVVRGRYTDPSDASLYQLVDYPEIEIGTVDDIERVDALDLACVQSASQAQRLAKQRLQRNLYRGTFSAKFNERAWQVNLGDVVTLSHISLGWDEKLFRVMGHGISLDGITALSLQEEHEDIYAWDEDESAPVVAAEPTAYDPLNTPFVLAIAELDVLGIAAYLTNVSHTTPASSAGVVSSYAGADGAFVVVHGTDDISDQFTLSTKSGGNPQALTVSYDNGADPRTYSVTGAGTGSGNFGHSGTNAATLTIRATGGGTYTGVVIDLVFSLAKSKAGVDGSPAKLLTISQDRPLISYDETGALSPGTQTTTFTANKQNTAGTVAWTLTDTLGNVLTPSTYLSATTGDSITMTAANFSAAIAVNGAQGVIVTGAIAADSLSDKVGLLKVQKGATGANAKNITVSSDRDAFTFDGGANLSPGTQSAVVTANPQNLVGGNVVWSYADNLGTASATLAALVTATSTNVRTVPSAVFTGTPTRLWLRVVATGQGAESGLSDAVTLYRQQDGASVLTMLLSNESHNIPTDAAGASGDFSGAIGQIKVFWGTTDVTATSTLSEVSETGCTGDVNTATNTPFTGAKGAYRVTALSADTAIYKMRAVYNPGSGNIIVDRDFTLAKSKTGATGTAGSNNAIVLLYQRSGTGSAPALPSGSAATYTFATGAVTGGTLNGWTVAIPAADGNPLYAIAQVASSNTATASLTAGGWAAAVLKDGAGVSTVLVTLHQRTATNVAPSVPAGTLTWTFATAALSGTLGSWSLGDAGAGSGAYHFTTKAVAFGTGATDTIATGEWSAPVLDSQSLTAAQIATLNAAVDDNILNIDEKKVLINNVAQLGARYTYVVAGAATLGISTTALTTSRSNFLTYLAALSPLYDDTSQDTTLSTNLAAALPSGWAGSAGAVANGNYYTITDSSSGAIQDYAYLRTGLTAGVTYTLCFVIKKDAVAGSTRTVLIRTFDGGGFNGKDVVIDTSTGAVVSTAGSPVSSGCYAISDTEWLVHITFVQPVGQTSSYMLIYPAVGTAGGGYLAATTGSVDIRDPAMVAGTFDKLGRDAFRYRLRDYSAGLELIGKSITDAAAARALAISGPATSSVTAKSDGTFDTGVLPKEVGFLLGDGAGGNSTASATWARTLKSGSATSSISVISGTAVLSVSALGGSSEFEITATVGGVIVARFNHKMTKVVTPATGSGGSGGTTGTGPITGANASTSYAAIVATVRAKAGAAGQVACTAAIEFTCIDDLNDTSISSTAKWQWRVIGGSYADITTAIAANTTAYVEDQGFGAYFRGLGYIDCNMTKTGLTNGTEYEFQCVAKVDESSRTLSYAGQGGAVAQCVGT